MLILGEMSIRALSISSMMLGLWVFDNDYINIYLYSFLRYWLFFASFLRGLTRLVLSLIYLYSPIRVSLWATVVKTCYGTLFYWFFLTGYSVFLWELAISWLPDLHLIRVWEIRQSRSQLLVSSHTTSHWASQLEAP